MKCQNCGENNANVRYSQNINGRKIEVFLCENCAKDLNVFDNFSDMFDFSFNNMFSNILNSFNGLRILEIPRIAEPVFETGGMHREFYNRSNPELDDALKRITNKNKGLSKKEKLEKELQECIKKENYEKAAEIRDELKKLL